MRNSLVKTVSGTDSFWFITVASLPRKPSLLALVKAVDAPLCLFHFQDDAGLIPDADRFGRAK